MMRTDGATGTTGAMDLPRLRDTVLDTTDPRRLAEFYRQLLGLSYRPGDEPPADGQPDERDTDWLVLTDEQGVRKLAFQRVDRLPEETWPEGPVPPQLHLVLSVPDKAALDRHHPR